MPFKSKAQRRWMYAAEARGELPKGTAERWEKHTKNKEDLPEKVSSDSKDSDKKDSEKKSASRSASPVPGPDPGRGNLLVKWPLVMNPNGGKLGGTFFLPAAYAGPNLLSKRLGKGPGSTQINSDGESPKLVHPMKIAFFNNPVIGVPSFGRTILSFLRKIAQENSPGVSDNKPGPVELEDVANQTASNFSGSKNPVSLTGAQGGENVDGQVDAPNTPNLPNSGNGPTGPLPGLPPPSSEGATGGTGSSNSQQGSTFGNNASNPQQDSTFHTSEDIISRRFAQPIVDEEGNLLQDEKGNVIRKYPTRSFDVEWFRRTFGPHYGRLEVVLSEAFTNPEKSFLLGASGIADNLYDLQQAQRRLEEVASSARKYQVTPYQLKQATDAYERAKSRFLRRAEELDASYTHMISNGFTMDIDGYVSSEVTRLYDSWKKERERFFIYEAEFELARKKGLPIPRAPGLGRLLTEDDLRRRIDARIEEIARRNRMDFIANPEEVKRRAWDWATQALLKQKGTGQRPLRRESTPEEQDRQYEGIPKPRFIEPYPQGAPDSRQKVLVNNSGAASNNSIS